MVGSSLFIAFIKEKSPVFFLVAAVTSTILLFSPQRLIANIGATQFVEKYREFIGFVFIFSIVFFICALMFVCFSKNINIISSQQ